MTAALPPVGTEEWEGAMRSVAEVRLTPDGRQRLQEELRALLARRRTAVLEYTAWCESAGDAGGAVAHAQTDLGLLDRRIAELRRALDRAGECVAAHQAPDTVGPGARVTVRWDDGAEETYTLVGPVEVDPRSGRISADSPVGQALLGRRPGDRVDVATPTGPSRLAVLAVA